MAGLGVSLLLGLVALMVFEGAVPQPGAWWRQPPEQLWLLAQQLFGRGSGTAVFRGLLLVPVLAAVWGLVGGWIARSELLRQRPAGDPDPGAESTGTPPTRFVRRKAFTLGTVALFPLIAAGLLLVPALFAGLVNQVLGMGTGALLVSVALPPVLLSSLFVVLVLVGSLSYSIMPAAVAAEGTDSWEAVSRGYSYLYQRPLHFAWWWGVALAVSGLPLLGASALLHAQPDLAGAGGRPVLGFAGAALSLSFFWTLQSLVYLKLRRAVDDVAENEIWDGTESAAVVPAASATTKAPEQSAPEQSDQRAVASGVAGTGQDRPAAGPAPPEPPAADRPVLQRAEEISFQDTIRSLGASKLNRLVALLAGVLWAALVLAGGALAAWQLTAGPGQERTLEGLRQGVLKLGEQRPLALVGLAGGVVVLGALGLGRAAKAVARMTAVRVVCEEDLPLPAAWSFARHTRGRGRGSALFVTGGVVLCLAAGFLAPLAWQGKAPWQEVAALGGCAAGLLGIGALGMGVVAVEGNPGAYARAGGVESYVGNGIDTLASAVVNLAVGLLRSLAVLGFAWSAWVVTCESLSWWGGPNVHWVRWGLSGGLRPPPEGGLYRAASAVAGFWFLLLSGLVLMYPLSYFLRWGAVCYLRARQQSEGVPPGQFELTEGERAALAARRAKPRRPLQRAADKCRSTSASSSSGDSRERKRSGR
jgi:hypothetical protein